MNNKNKKIQAEIKYEEALMLIRKFRNYKKGTKEYKQRQELTKFVLGYEKEHYPYGEDNFDEWFEKKQDEKYYNERQNIIKEAEIILEQKKQFREDRINEIKKVLKKKKLKQQYLTELFGVKKSYVSLLMNGKKSFSPAYISILHYKLGVPFEKLIPKPDLLQKIESEEDIFL